MTHWSAEETRWSAEEQESALLWTLGMTFNTGFKNNNRFLSSFASWPLYWETPLFQALVESQKKMGLKYRDCCLLLYLFFWRSGYIN